MIYAAWSPTLSRTLGLPRQRCATNAGVTPGPGRPGWFPARAPAYFWLGGRPKFVGTARSLAEACIFSAAAAPTRGGMVAVQPAALPLFATLLSGG